MVSRVTVDSYWGLRPEGFSKLPWHEKIDKSLAKIKKKLTKEEYQGFYVRMRIKYAEKFDQQLIDESKELS